MQGSLRTRLWITVVATATLCLAALAGGGPSAAAAPAAKPGIITSAGQSSDAVMVNVLANTQLKLGLDFDPLVQAESLAGYRTLVVVVGASAKGLGAAGINEEQEMARVTALLEQAKAQDAFVLLMHVGGTARRGPSSNPLIEAVAAYADAMIVVRSGNEDGFFTQLAQEYGIPLTEVERIVDAREPLSRLFGA
ncbi:MULTISPECIES: DUF6305 family protein [Limnochorda]|uniref:DUF6305 family protein n=1 Tax=Limnochorda TaxID=1676651 RepID=UPI001D6E0435|nr:DUF6305 family protein [Limnochorda pilosa]MBO2486693.1 hypothetical protein [Bacillota bacterium]MBO2519974.1 hypothetical protein [Bacillota bacterium]